MIQSIQGLNNYIFYFSVMLSTVQLYVNPSGMFIEFANLRST